ncbi:neuralized-like protein 4 isoform X1 [Babylonia areolata]|uniref:neuralized-like protein 4 isoform X1 n=1 Tax=Babylonia areolata TaxID=304850 RepID=UPI003FD12A4D
MHDLKTTTINSTWPSAVVFFLFLQDDNNKVGAALRDLRENHRVGLALDSAHCLHLYVDGQDQGIAARGLTDPCYAMFDVVDYYEQITALPPTRLGL